MHLIAILNNIRSLHNIGSIFRTADAAGVKKLYLGGITSTPLDRFGRVRPQFSKVALGAEKYVSWEKTISTPYLIEKLKKQGYKIFAIEQSNKSIPYYRLKIKGQKLKIALIVGNEINGLPKIILAKADKILEIPMLGGKESLNVAIAFGIVTFYIINSR